MDINDNAAAWAGSALAERQAKNALRRIADLETRLTELEQRVREESDDLYRSGQLIREALERQ